MSDGMPFTAGWGLIHLGLLPLVFLIISGACLRAAQVLPALFFLGLLAFWSLSSISTLGFEWWACGSIANMLAMAVLSIPIWALGRLIGG